MAAHTGSARRTARERRVITAGAVVVLLALLVTYVVLPLARRWSAREARLADVRARIATADALRAHATAIDSAATDEERALAGVGRRVLRARSATLAASALQSLLQDAADASRLSVTRLDVASPGMEADSARISDAGVLPATLAAYGDIHGLAAALDLLARGPRVVHVDRLTVQLNPALRGAPDMLAITMTLRAPVALP